MVTTSVLTFHIMFLRRLLLASVMSIIDPVPDLRKVKAFPLLATSSPRTAKVSSNACPRRLFDLLPHFVDQALKSPPYDD